MCNATQDIERIGAEAAGCWLDCSRGIYIGEEVQEYALAYGWSGPRVNSDGEWYHDAYDEAENYLNNNIADDNHYFGCNESGDWGLWPIDDDDSI